MESRRPAGADTAARAALRSRMGHPTSLRLDEVQPNPRNPRYDYDDPETHELATTLAQVGQLQPALVVSRAQYLQAYPDQHDALGPEPWVVIVGNRRLAASRLAGRASLEVRVAADLETEEQFEDRILVENIQRKELPPLLEAAHLQRRLNRPGQTIRSVGEAIGKSHTYVQQRLDLLRMIPEFQQLLRDGEINIKTGRRLGGLPEDEQRAILAAGPPFGVDGESRTAGPGEGRVGNRVPSRAPIGERTAGTRRGDGRPTSAAAPTDLETTRESVEQWLESALAELDRALPAGGDSELGAALADARRHIEQARSVLHRASEPV
jgi:ParB family chromosome partitioning protein